MTLTAGKETRHQALPGTRFIIEEEKGETGIYIETSREERNIPWISFRIRNSIAKYDS